MSLPGRPKGEYRSAKHVGCLMNAVPRSMKPRIRLVWITAGLTLTGAVLTWVFLAYLNPHRLVEFANRVWACF